MRNISVTLASLAALTLSPSASAQVKAGGGAPPQAAPITAKTARFVAKKARDAKRQAHRARNAATVAEQAAAAAERAASAAERAAGIEPAAPAKTDADKTPASQPAPQPAPPSFVAPTLAAVPASTIHHFWRAPNPSPAVATYRAAPSPPTYGYYYMPVVPPEADRADEEEDKPLAFGFELSTGVASTRLYRGEALLSSKTVPTMESQGAVLLHNAGPGTVSVFGASWAALAEHQSEPDAALEFQLGAQYTLKAHEHFEASIGYAVGLLPYATAHVDATHEALLSAAAPNPYVVPTLSVAAEWVRQRGAYAALGGHHEFEVGPLSITPTVSAAIAGYEGQPVDFNDVTVTSPVRWDIIEHWHVAFIPTYAYLVRKTVPDPTFTGRSTVVAQGSAGVEY